MWKRRIRFLFSWATLKHLFRYFFIVLGTLWLCLEVAAFFDLFSKTAPDDNRLLYFFLAISALATLVLTVRRSLPPLHYSKKSKGSNVEIAIKVGDLLSEPGNVAIGCNDCFDTESPRVIGAKSLMAQLVRRKFGGDHAALDGRIGGFLTAHGIDGAAESNKLYGRDCRYPIGTVAIVEEQNQKFFLTTFTKTSTDGRVAKMSKEELWTSLSRLWEAVDKHGHKEPLAMPVWGSGLTGFKAPRISLIQLLLLSFVIATRDDIFSRKLTLVVHDGDYNPEEMMEAIGLIKTLDF